MSLESEIQNLTAAVENLAFIIKQTNVIQKPEVLRTTSNEFQSVTVNDVTEVALKMLDVHMPVPVAHGKAPASAEPVMVAPPVVAMPPVPSFITPAPQPAQVTHSKAPFNDSKGLMTYVMASYQALGAEKGAQIQSVLTNLKYQNINDIKPEDYDALFAGVEALK